MQNSEDYLDRLTESEKVALKSKMYDAVKAGIEVKNAQLIRRKRIWQKTKIAASMSLVLMSMLAVWIWSGKVEMVYQTAENEILELTLPDNSTVTLNSNSTLGYQSSRLSGFDRKVRLEGEAFFSIQKDPEGKTFEVNEGGNLGVTVLGTKFNLKKSKLVEKVTLIEGSVKLGYQGENGTSEHLMTPGESVKMDPKKKELKSTRIENPERLISWKDRKLKMKNERLEEVLDILIEIYDLTLDETSIVQPETTVSGSLPLSDQPEEVLENLGISFDTSVELKGNKVTIGNVKK